MDDAAEGKPDALFALVCGLYLAAIGGPPAMIAARGAIADVGLLYGLLLAVLTTVTVFGTLAVRRVAGLAGTLGRTRLAWWLAAGPAVVGVGPFGLRAAGLVPIGTPAAVLAAFGGLAAGALGFVVVSMATTRAGAEYEPLCARPTHART